MTRETETGTMKIEIPDGPTVSALLQRPERSRALLVLAHGAGAGMRHSFMEAVAERLATRSVATLRYQFPYMESGSRRPDRPAVAHAAVRSAVARALEVAAELPAEQTGERRGGVPVFAGGKSFGGRMTSSAAADSPLEGVRGLIFLGFPLHPSGRPGTERAAHLSDVRVPMLFVQGTRDKLADLTLLRPVLTDLAGLATLHVVDGADHSFHVLKRSGRTDAKALDEIADAVQRFSGARI